MNYYHGSLVKALYSIYSNHHWQLWKFAQVLQGYWYDISHQRDYFDSLARDMNLQTFEQWYDITREDVEAHEGSDFLAVHYDRSVARALQTVYPEYNWKVWQFRRVTAGFWDNEVSSFQIFIGR